MVHLMPCPAFQFGMVKSSNKMGHGFHSYLKLLVQGYCDISLWISLLLWYVLAFWNHTSSSLLHHHYGYPQLAQLDRPAGAALKFSVPTIGVASLAKNESCGDFSHLSSSSIFSKMRKFVSWFFRYIRKVQMSKSGFRAHPLQVQFWLLFAVQWSHSEGRQRDSARDANRLGRSWEKQPK